MIDKRYYENIPYGYTLPLDNPHGFSVSMPTIQDVIDYEEKSSRSKEAIKSAYPRMVIHPYIKLASEYICSHIGVDSQAFILPTSFAFEEVSRLSGVTPDYAIYKEYVLALFDDIESEEALEFFTFMKHCGYMIFSREAEDIIKSFNSDFTIFKEDSNCENSTRVIKDILSDGYNSKDIILNCSGMNSIYAGYLGSTTSQLKQNRDIVIIYGWAYSDTLSIIKKCSSNYKIITDVSSTKELEEYLKEFGDRVASIYLETVSNPLIEVPDIPRVYELSREHNFLVLIDNTFATPWLVDISNYCDLIFESLTKFASGFGDVMAGAIILPKNSRLDRDTFYMIDNYGVPLYKRDLDKLAFNILGYKDRVLRISNNSKIIENELKKKKSIKKIYSVTNELFINNWKKIARGNYSCCVLSFLVNGDFEEFYNGINIPKGPSLGSQFPILMSYTLLAHYFDTKCESGKELLNSAGLDPHLLRLSVGDDEPYKVLDQIL